MFLPVATGTPITKSQSTIFIARATVPIRYMMRLSTLSMLAVLTAEPRAMPMSSRRKAQMGPGKLLLVLGLLLEALADPGNRRPRSRGRAP